MIWPSDTVIVTKNYYWWYTVLRFINQYLSEPNLRQDNYIYGS